MALNRYRYLLILLLWTLPAWSNMSAPWRSGDAVGEPAADLRGLVVRNESLVLDLRPLGLLKRNQDRAYVLVEATYNIERKGPDKSVELVFVAPGQEGGAEVWLDGQAVSFTAGNSTELPARWTSPPSTPRAGGGKPLNFQPLNPATVLHFKIKFGPGSHTVRVKYDLKPTAVCSESPLRYWQLAYILSPARQWAGFGTLDAQVLVPAGWQVATSLPMEAFDGGYKGHWQGIPADSLGLSLQAPVPAQWSVVPLLAGLGLVLCGCLGWAVGVWVGGSRHSLVWTAAPCLMLAATMMTAFLLTGLAALERVSNQTPGQGSWSWSYAASMEVIFLSIPLAGAGWMAAQLAALLAAKRRRVQLSSSARK